MGQEYDNLEKLFPVENEEPLAAFGFEQNDSVQFFNSARDYDQNSRSMVAKIDKQITKQMMQGQGSPGNSHFSNNDIDAFQKNRRISIHNLSDKEHR